MTLLDGKALSAKIKQELKEKNKMLKENGVETCLAILQQDDTPQL